MALAAGGRIQFTFTTTNVVGNPGQETSGGVFLQLNEDNTVTVTSKWGDVETESTGTWSDAAIANPDEAVWTNWTENANVYWTEGEAHYSGILGDDDTFTGSYSQADSSGTFATVVACNWKCQASTAGQTAKEALNRTADQISDAAKNAANKINEAIQNGNGTTIALGVVGGICAIGVALYCCCKKDAGEMGKENSEGGQKQIKRSLLVAEERA